MIIFRGRDKPFCLDRYAEQLLPGRERSGVPIHLPRKQWELLRYLAENHERLVSKEELVTKVWGATVSDGVTDDAISRAISGVRRALGDADPDHPAFIKTVHGRGFRFIAEIEKIEPPSPSPLLPVPDIAASAIAERSASDTDLQAGLGQLPSEAAVVQRLDGCSVWVSVLPEQLEAFINLHFGGPDWVVSPLRLSRCEPAGASLIEAFLYHRPLSEDSHEREPRRVYLEAFVHARSLAGAVLPSLRTDLLSLDQDDAIWLWNMNQEPPDILRIFFRPTGLGSSVSKYSGPLGGSTISKSDRAIFISKGVVESYLIALCTALGVPGSKLSFDFDEETSGVLFAAGCFGGQMFPFEDTVRDILAYIGLSDDFEAAMRHYDFADDEPCFQINRAGMIVYLKLRNAKRAP
jgi:DNA-binding winged helix-turn-helix (wHTH) protein